MSLDGKETGTSAVGNLTGLDAGQVLLPGFVDKRADGLWLDITALDSPDLFLRFVERVFAAGARFAGLDYTLFLNLLFDYTPRDIAALLEKLEKAGRRPELRLAADIVPFPEERKAAYRGVKLLGKGEAVEYMFEPVTIDIETQVPRYGDADENGNYPIVGHDIQKSSERVYLDFDEFVAALWDKGIRYGIDAAAVRAAIAADTVERLTIAKQKPPEQGKDASIAEQTKALHRDDSPRLLPNGRVDLCQFHNRFPQVTAGTRLFKKVPRADGVSGWNVQGGELPPAAVKDFDITTLAGPGTRIERIEGAGEFVVAAIDGFLDIDTQSSQLSISEKIVNRGGVSARTTGDLALAGDEYEEHGEVQEKRKVEGHHMSFHADVFGHIVSSGGRVVFKQGITGGSAESPGGSIVVEGSASRATLDARRGVIEAAQVEGSLLIAQVVRVGRAVLCDIVADEVIIEQSEGCAIACRRATIGKTTTRRDDGTMITLLLPDVARYDKSIEEAATDRREAAATEVAKREQLAAMAEQSDMKSYLSLQPKIKAKTMVLSPVQEANWQKLLNRIAPILREYSRLYGEVQHLKQEVADSQQRVETLQQERNDAIAAVGCTIREVAGETLVRSRRLPPAAPSLASLPPKELHIRLREAGTREDRIFTGDSGSMAWPATEPGG